MVMEGHNGAFFYEKHNKSVVVVAFDGHFVELGVEVIFVSELVLSSDAK
jgi:hypothetical protein